MSWYEDFPPYIYVGSDEQFDGVYTYSGVDDGKHRTHMIEYLSGNTYVIENGVFASKELKNHFIHAQWIDVPDLDSVIEYYKNKLPFVEMVKALKMLAITQGCKKK